MATPTKNSRIKLNLLFRLLFCNLLLSGLYSCKSDKKTDQSFEYEEVIEEKPNYIEITTKSMEFFAPDTITSGWNTFKYSNQSNETHFFLMDKYPEGITIENMKNELLPPFDIGMDLINEGKTEEGFAAFGGIPEWFGSVVNTGGSGFIGPKHSSITTIKLDPGYYIMECYVKMPNGKWHTSMGMAKEIIISDEDSGNSPPEADVEVTIAKEAGINYTGDLNAGKHIFSVNFVDQGPHEHFMGHDVNLVKLADGADLEKLEAWMNWSTPFGLKTPVPNGVTFLGGVNDSPAGSTGYFEAELSPGNYAFISEVPNAKAKGMLKTFTVN